MRIKYLKLKKWLIATVGGLLGLSVTGCLPALEYGTPEASYHVKGIVTDKQGQPIEGIGIGQIIEWDDTGDSLRFNGYKDTTNAEGRYEVNLGGAFPNRPLSLDFRDIDGATNGSYNDTVVTINTEGVNLTGGDGHWYEGVGNITQNVVLTEKTNE